MDGRSEIAMWRNMKKKVYDFFFYEQIEMIEVIDEEKKKKKQPPIEPSERTIETKVMYEYPEKREFRFPIIPDHTHEPIYKRDETLDVPAYMRKERSLDHPPVNRIEEQEQDKGPVNDRPTSPAKQRAKEERFVPTDVPSPIYGYHRRKNERTLRETPAYMRRQMREEHDASANEAATTEVEEVIENHSVVTDIEKDPGEKPPSNERLEEDLHTIERKVERSALQTSKTEASKKDPVQEQEEIRTDHKAAPSISQREERSGKSADEQDIPFNVLMTRQDKIRYEQQQTKEKQTKNTSPTPTMLKKDYSIPMHLLNDPIKTNATDQQWLQEQQRLLEETLVHFNVKATVVNVTQGPSVTRFEVQPSLGVKVSKVRNLSDDIKLNLSAKDIRIEAPIPGKNTIGIEIPNLDAQTVGLYEILHGDAFMSNTAALPIGLGVTIEGEPLITDIANMPHGLIAGATGSGKSVCINTILLSLLYRSHYDDVKLMLIDPKMVELTPYNGVPHLVSPVITDVKAATAALKWAVEEMEDRYKQFVEEGVRDIHRFNEKVLEAGREEEKMPFMVIVIDELADLMMVAPQDVEDSICRIAQKARACGMHLLIATQRPSVDVITGLIKANVPTRIAFSVSSQVDSRTIIDTNGAERLLGKGDMLFIENGSGKSMRLQGAFVSDDEIDRVVQTVKQTAPPQYLFEEEQLLEMTTEMDDDPLLEEVVDFILEQNSASTSMLQRQFRIGYNRAARLMEALEQKGIISGQNGSKPRDILMRK